MSISAQSCVEINPQIFMTHCIGVLHIPGPIQTILYLVETGFWIGRRIRNWIFIVENPQEGFFGAFLQEQLSANSFVRVVSQVVHLARIITELDNKAKDFVRSIGRFGAACTIHSLECSYFAAELTEKERVYVRGKAPHYSASLWLVSFVMAKVKQIFIRVMKMLSDAYQVLYSLFELREAITLNLGENFTGLLPMEISRLTEAFSGREWEMSAVIMEHEEAIDKIFEATLLPWSTRRLAETLASISVGARVVNLVMKGPSRIGCQVKQLVSGSGSIAVD
jgi:hypothetical protein